MDMFCQLKVCFEYFLKIIQQIQIVQYLGGRIDHAHHDTRPQRSLQETVDFSETIEKIRSQINEEDTLMVVTADHSHVFTVSGYPVSPKYFSQKEFTFYSIFFQNRGTNILGFAGTGDDRMRYFTLSYANGPGLVLVKKFKLMLLIFLSIFQTFKPFFPNWRQS